MRTIGLIVLAVLAFDVACFLAWVASGQTPTDGFFFGAITATLLSL